MEKQRLKDKLIKHLESELKYAREDYDITAMAEEHPDREMLGYYAGMIKAYAKLLERLSNEND